MTKLLLKVSCGQKYSWTKIILLTVRGTFTPFNFQPRFYVEMLPVGKGDFVFAAGTSDVTEERRWAMTPLQCGS